MNENDQNPYQAPESDISNEPQTNALLEQPRRVSAGQGFNWLEKGISTLVVPHFAKWAISCAIYALIVVLISLVAPTISFILQFLAPFFTAGVLIGCHKLRNGQSLSNQQVFEGFTHSSKIQILLFCLLQVVLVVVLAGLVFLMGGMSLSDLSGFQQIQANPEDPQVFMELFKKFAYLIPVLLILGLLFSLAVFFAPSLIVFNGKSAPAAVGISFKAGLKNILPYLLFMLIVIILFVVIGIIVGIVSALFGFASATLGQAVTTFIMTIISLPLMGSAMYTSYRDIFYGESAK